LDVFQYAKLEGELIIEKIDVGPFASNCYIVGDESSKEGMIIDPGAEADKILKRVEDLGLEVKFIVLTHAHMDHIGAVKGVKEAICLSTQMLEPFINRVPMRVKPRQNNITYLNLLICNVINEVVLLP